METKNEIFRPFVTDETTFEEISNGIIGENKDNF